MSALLLLLGVFLPVLSGCSINQYQPSHFQVTTIVEKPKQVQMAGVPLEPYFCKFGAGMPIATEKSGLMSEPLAQRIAADCANEALREVIASRPAMRCRGVMSAMADF